MIPYWKHVGMWLLLSAGACSVVSRIAALFGYSGRFTPELLIACIAISLMAGAVSYRRASRMPARPPRQPSSELMKALSYSYQDWTKAQRLRWSLAWIGSTIVFLIADFVVYQTTLHLFPDLMGQMVIVIALAISGAIAALFGGVFYQRILAKMFPDRNHSN